jgi:GNAT superfamily N-acetyltransferase
MTATMILRQATSADLAAIRAIADAEDEPPTPEVGFPEALDAYYLHLIEHGEVLLAVDDDEAGGVVGFGATIESGRGVHLADLFVRRDRQGGGIGRRLLESLFADRWPRTTFSSDDPRAMPLYIRMGMRPLWPNLYLDGDARRLPQLPPSLRVDAAGADRVAELERAFTGVDRPTQHAYWAAQPAAVPLVVRDGDRAVAIGYARSKLRGGGRWINSFVVAPGVPAHDPTLAAMRWSADAEGRIGTCVLGPHPIVPTLIDAGFRIVDRDTFQASDPALVDPERLLPNTGFL